MQWSNGTGWHDFNSEHRVGAVKALKTGAGTDVKLRPSIDASASAQGTGVVFMNANYTNNDASCGGDPYSGMSPFQIPPRAATLHRSVQGDAHFHTFIPRAARPPHPSQPTTARWD
ncbi:hypothetical protein ACWGLE_06320 [Streptomyces sp. NPDC055897]